ncbi:MAG: FAD-binding oxidoreductase [Myxococcota bacterium]
MIRAQDLEALRSALGSDGVAEHAPQVVDGCEISATLRPADGATAAAALATLGKAGLGVLVRGGGTRLAIGNPPTRADAILSTEHLCGIDQFEPAEGVCHVGAGTSIADVRGLVSTAGWDVPLDPPGAASTVGGTLAAAAVGPRSQAHGPPRDAVLGLEVILPTGERTRCGGRVVKNVTGYDLAKLYTGSFGSLAVIEAVWLRLRPLPARVRGFRAEISGIEAACAVALRAARRSTTRAVCLVGGAPDLPEGGHRVDVELAGDEPAVDRDAAWLEGDLGAAAAPSGAFDAVREHQGAFPGGGGLRFRIATLASRLPALLEALHGEGAETLGYPGLRLVYAGFQLPASGAEAEAERVFAAVAAAVARAEGQSLCEQAPFWAKAGRDVHGETAALVPIFRSLKQHFDPRNTLNPGRFAGGL